MPMENTVAAETARNLYAFKSGLNASFGSLAAGTKQMQALASEAMEMTLDSLQRASDTFEKMRAAKSWNEVMKIEGDFVSSSLEGFTSRSGRLFELASKIPSEMTSHASEAVRAGTDTIRQGAEQLQQATRENVERVQQAMDQSRKPPR
jgi:hypothetical protein